MSGKRYTEKFKTESIRQVTECGHPVEEVASRLGMTAHSVYKWRRKYSAPVPAELRKLEAVIIALIQQAKELPQVLYQSPT